MKRFVSVLLVLAFLLTCIPAVAVSVHAATVAEGKCGDNLTWVLDDNGTLTISGTGKMNDYVSDSKTPWYWKRTQIKSVVIEDGVTSIGNYALSWCASFTNIAIPNSVTSIGDYAFMGCTKLASITIPESITSIGESAFSSCHGLTTVTIPASVVSIGEAAFKMCSGLTQIKVAGGNPNYSSDQQGGLYNKNKTVLLTIPGAKTSFVIPNSVTEIGNSACESNDDLRSLTIPDSVTKIGDSAFNFCRSLTELTLPANVTSIGNWAFGAWAITELTIPASVTSIGAQAFTECDELKTIEFKGNAPEIGENAFCYVNADVYYPEGNATWTADVMQNYGGELDWGNQEPEDVGISGTCGDNLTWNLLDDKLTISGTGEMYDYTTEAPGWAEYSEEIYVLDVESGVTSIGDWAMYAYPNLISVTLSPTVERIGDGAFYGCSRIDVMTLSTGIKAIGDQALCGCSALDSFNLYCDAPTISENAFEGVTATVRYPANNATWTEAMLQDYGGTITWKAEDIEDRFDKKGTCGDNLTWVLDGNGTLTISGTGQMDDYVDDEYAPWDEYCEDIWKLVINSGVTSIGDWAIYDLPRLTSVYIPASVTSIGDGAFYRCTALAGITIPSGVTAIGEEAFKNCSALAIVTLPDTLTQIGASAFEYAHALKEVAIPSSVKTIGDEAFGDCAALNTITFDGNAPVIGADAFYNVTATAYYPANDSTWSAAVRQNYGGTLTWVAQETEGGDEEPDSGNSGTCGANLTWTLTEDGTLTISGTGEMNDYADEDAPWDEYCSKIVKVIINSGVTGIGDWAFYDCTNLTSVSISANVKRIGDGAFYRCTSLPSVVLPSGVTAIGEQAFKNCSKLKSITLPNTLTEIGASAFEYAHALEAVTIPSSVKTIGNEAFGGCSGLNTVTFAGNAPTIGASAFSSVVATAYYPADNSTWSATVRQDYGGTLSWIAEGDEDAIGGSCGAQLTWTLSEDGLLLISGIGEMYDYVDDEYAPWDEYCSKIVKVVIKSGVTSIGDWAIYNCPNLTSVTIPSSVKRIGDGAFYRCTSLPSVVIPDGVTAIGAEAFKNCSLLKSVTLPNTLTEIGASAFEYAHALANITIPSSVKTIGNEAFGDCAVLKTITFAGNAPTIGADAFYDVTATVYYPKSNSTWTSAVRLNYGGTLTWVTAEISEEKTGDVDGSGEIDNEDVARLLWHTLFPETYPIAGNADINDDGSIDNEDVAYLLWHTLFPETYPLS